MVPCSLNSAFTDPPAGAVGSASTRSPRSRLWIAPRRFCRCARDPRAADHDYIRHGTNSLFAALEVATGKITADACYPRHTHAEFLAFLKLVAKAHPRVRLCVICDNYATHKHPAVRAWLDKNPRVTLHFTPTSCSWLNMVEIFFGIITRQAIRRGTFTDVTELEHAIRAYIDSYNQRARPFAWTKTADELLGKIKRKSINNTRH